MKMRDDQYRISKICVDSYEDRVLKGRLYNSFSQTPIFFNSTMEFLLQMENLMNKTECPEPFSKVRIFQQIQAPSSEPARESKEYPDAVCTFMIRVLFRQNTSWQGRITWMNENREECFRSVLELLLLIDSAAY